MNNLNIESIQESRGIRRSSKRLIASATFVFCAFVFGGVTSAYAVAPDLTVSGAVTASPNPATAGNSVTINFTIANITSGNANASTTKIQIKNSSNTLLVQNTFSTPAISGNGSYAAHYSLTLPSNASGTCTAYVILDNNNTAGQTNYNNDMANGSFTVNPVSVAPDLTVQGAVTASPNPATAGNSVTINFTIANITSGNANASTTKIQIKNSSNTLLVQNTFSTPAISGNGSYTAHYSLTLPSNASGTCTAYVILDNDNTAGQTNYNNDMANGSFTVNPVSVAPDLTVQGSVTASPNPATAGNSVTINFTIVNITSGNANASTTKIQIKNSSNTLLVENTFSTPAISGNGSYAAHYSLTLPSNASGTCTAYVILDNDNTAGQTNYNNDMANGSFTVNPVSVAPDLTVQGSVTASPNPATAGNSVTINFTIANITSGNANASTTKIQIKNSSNTLLVQNTFSTPAISGNGSYAAHYSLTLPSNASGTCTAYVILDNDNTAGQTNYNNDMANGSFTVNPVSVAPDLTVQGSVTASPNPATAGNSVTINFTIVNITSGNANASTTKIQIKNSSNTLLVENTFSTPAISGNGSYAAHYSLTLPSNASGTCTAYVILDNDNTAGQTNYNNDMANGSFTVAGSATPTPSATTNTATNVTISGATLNATVNPNGSNTVVHFEYGTTTAYGTSTSPISIGSGNTPLNQSDTVSSLTPSTIYHYHVVADNAGGTAYGNDASFTTHTDQQTQPVLSVTPQDVALPSAAESTNLTVSNSGTGTLSYNASVTSGSSWLQITSGSVGGNSGTIIVAYSANTGAQRIGNVIVTANAAGGSPSVVTITQAAAPPAGTQPLGIDVYSPRYPIVWNQVSEAGKTFAFLKATEGVTFTDTEFLSSNIQDARQNNILVSAYHFALPLDEPGVAGAESEAQHFLDVATPYIGDGYLPPILDIEDDLASRHPEITTCLTPDHSHIDLVCLLTKPVLSAWVRAWVRKVELTAHTRPIVYMDGHYARDGMEIDLASYPLWIAAPGSPTGDPPLGLGPWSRWVFKQYSTTGGVPGVHGTDVDQDSFYSSVSALNELTRRSAGPDITSISAVSLTAGQPVAFQITATGSPTEYDIVDLPDGLTVNPLSGLITGVPAASGTFDATISATNSSGTATAPLHLNILPATSLVITSSTVVSTEGGQTLAYQIIATNSPTSYSATGLPAGLTIDSVTGLISGVPTTVGTFNVMITVSNAAGGSPTGSTNGTAMTTVVFYVAGEQPAFPAQLGNISTRLRVQTGDNAMIGGIIVTGPQSKTVVVRGIGPSLLVPGALADPVIEVHGSAGELLATNDNWRDDDPIRVQHVIDSGLAPSNDLEAAKWGILTPGAYTVVVRGNNNTTGIGLFEVYDLDRTEDSKLANISTRGFVDTGDNVMIGGTIIVGSVPTTVLFRAIGPSLVNFGISNALQDPMLELHDSNGALTASNDNWRDTQEAEIIATGIPPSNNFESAILVTLPANNSAYTAIVRGKDNTTGVAVVEAYQLQ